MDPDLMSVRDVQGRLAAGFLKGGGSCAEIIAARDWSITPLGGMEDWPPILRSTLSIILSSPVPIVTLWGPAGVMLYNDAYSVFAGGRHPTLLGSNVREGWPEVADFNDNVMKVGLAGGTLRYEDQELTLFRRGVGEQVWMNLDYSPIRDEHGEPVAVMSIVVETTEKVSAQRWLRGERDRLKSMFEQAPGFIAMVSGAEHVFELVNPAYLKLVGKRELLGRPIKEALPEVEGQGFFELLDRAFVDGISTVRLAEPVALNRHPGTPSETRYVDFSYEPVRGTTGEVVGVFIQGTDVTRHVASEQLARENVERVQLALAAGAIIGTWFWDLRNDRFAVDEAFANAFGLDPAQGRAGLSLEQVIANVHPDDLEGLATAINDAIKRGGAYAHQYRVRRADGRFYWIEANGRVNHGPDGTPLTFPGVLLDVEQRRAVQEERDRAAAALRALNETLEQRVVARTAELMRAEEQLRQSQKMEAVGQLTGGLAHDFNNLLAGISGSLHLLGIRLSQGRLADVDKYVVAAQGAVRRAAALTHRLLAFSRRQTLDPRPTDVNALVNGMTDLVQRTAGPGIHLEAVGAAGLWTAFVDSGQLENSLLNLCINARDAMPDGGRITIETANKWIDRNAAQTHDMPEGQYLSLCVTDTGTGMAPDVVAKAFDPFFTTKPIGQGTGLGLSMIYGFAKQSGGQVRIYSEVGQGTTVCIYLPRFYGDAGKQAGDNPAESPSGTSAGETVLVVDDEPSVRMLIVDVLEELGYTVLEAADSASGLKLLQSDVRIDVLVSDVGLPGGMNGRQMADAARQTRPELQVLFITGYAENAVIGNGHLEPGMHVMTKPFSLDVFAAKIRQMIEV
jgi:PAS domain S-box-containing protein